MRRAQARRSPQLWDWPHLPHSIHKPRLGVLDEKRAFSPFLAQPLLSQKGQQAWSKKTAGFSASQITTQGVSGIIMIIDSTSGGFPDSSCQGDQHHKQLVPSPRFQEPERSKAGASDSLQQPTLAWEVFRRWGLHGTVLYLDAHPGPDHKRPQGELELICLYLEARGTSWKRLLNSGQR